MEIRPIAYIRTQFPEKFGIPRQSGLAASLRGTIVFEPEFRNPDALRGLEGFTHMWLIWEFSANLCGGRSWQPTVRPPRLGGNVHMGVFATRSPFRPNPLGLSCVRIDSIEYEAIEGPVIHVLGADLMDGTPVYDIKPYLPYADSYPDAEAGYVDSLSVKRLNVDVPDAVRAKCGNDELLGTLIEVLSLDPRPSYHDDPDRIYGMSFSGLNVRFKVIGDLLSIEDIEL
ncbi:MAG: tRNA (N6-threonylcarbamoyladenosine(37)-N6)-methyltransferase TrmO [Bacteroidales bacterium]|nr:tRNA (N6-threonylcarbamoyladenosine(37)-N6)-methyltransferase TrmO [Bacteroidales bacterium]